MSIKRGDLFSEQAGRRPVLVIQNDVGNEYAPTTIVAPLTTKDFSKIYPVNVHIPKGIGGLNQDGTVLLSQIRTVDKSRLQKKIGHLPPAYLAKVNEAIKISLGL